MEDPSSWTFIAAQLDNAHWDSCKKRSAFCNHKWPLEWPLETPGDIRYVLRSVPHDCAGFPQDLQRLRGQGLFSQGDSGIHWHFAGMPIFRNSPSQKKKHSQTDHSCVILHWCCWRGQEQLDYSPFRQNRVWSDHHRLFRLRHFVYVCHVTCLMSGTNKKPLPLLLGARTLHIYIYYIYIVNIVQLLTLQHLQPPYPICSMYSIFTYIWVIYGVNVGKYSIHGAYGYVHKFWCFFLRPFFFARRWMWPRISNWQVNRASVSWHHSLHCMRI